MPDQISLDFTARPPTAKVAADEAVDPREEQEMHLARVATKIRSIIIDFCAARWQVVKKRDFHMIELVQYVASRSGIAPDSASRILRMLRVDGKIDYVVVNRRDSLYRITSFNGDAP